VISRRSRYVTSAIEKDGKRSSYSSSNNSSSSEDNNAPGKRNHSKTDSDASVKTHKQKHRKCKNSSRHSEGSGKSQSKRRKIDDCSDEEKAADSRNCANGSTSKDRREDRASTPSNNKWLQVPCTPDSGIKSGVSSTGGKNSETTRKERRDGGAGDSSDHEQKLKNLECFRKKVEELARRSYRSAFKAQTLSTTSDSSD
jgi:hypothetical protein